MNVVALQLKTKKDFRKNLENLIKQIKKVPKESFVLAPELVLNGYAYDRLNEAAFISQMAINELKKLSVDYTIALTLTIKKYNKFYNVFHLFSDGQIVHTQGKNKLFVLNDEKKNFASGDKKDIKIFELNGLKIAALICFEIRFIDFWKKLQGADIILVPSMWGKPRKEQFEILTTALAVANQCFVIASNSADNDMAKSSAIITPFGKAYRDDKSKILQQKINLKEIKKMRRYMNIGIK